MNQFWFGVARAFDLFGVLRDPEVDRILETSDAEALQSDWDVAFRDLQRAETSGSTTDGLEDP